MKRREGIVCLPLPPSHLRTLSSRVLAHNPQDEAAASAPPEAFVYYVVAASAAGKAAHGCGHRQPTIIYHGNISSLPPPEPTAARPRPPPLPPVPKPQWKLARPTDSPHYYHRRRVVGKRTEGKRTTRQRKLFFPKLPLLSPTLPLSPGFSSFQLMLQPR